VFDLKQCLVDVQTRTGLYGINTHRVLTKHGIEPRGWLLYNETRACESSFPALGISSLYNGKPFRTPASNTKQLRNPAKNRFKLLQMVGEERSRRIKTSNGGDRRKTKK